MRLSLLLFAALVAPSIAAPAPGCNAILQHWLYSSQIDDKALAIMDRSDIVGVQALYSWKSLEQAEGKYNFSNIQGDLDVVRAKGKKLWIQLQDRSFNPKMDPVPKYMKTPFYSNGSAPTCDGDNCEADFQLSGWAAQQWIPAVRKRYQALLKALAEKFDGKVYGLNLPETSIEVNQSANGYTNEGYFNGELENAGYAAEVFKETYVVQYVNFWADGWADDNNRFTDSFNYFAIHGVGVGGPDLIPNKTAQVKNSYPFLTGYHDKVPITVVAVQEPDLAEKNPKTGKQFTKTEFVDYAVNVLKVRIIFWAASSPWLAGN
ncbi:hypothetical protein V500_01011 [Pseudogymnoascus sp. VKM F-4518 (FW-2643)]|nr:hypothetical protein V500_01011 [Pseudogymnoascus sp. VKM F-4518 (FW-2643)]